MTGIPITVRTPRPSVSLHQTSFRVRHECPYRDLSERHPDLTIREWHLYDCQVLELTAPTVPAADVLADVTELGTVLHRRVDDGLHLVVRACRCRPERSMRRRFEEHDCLYQPPTVYREGWEHYSVVAFDEADLRDLFRALDDARDVELLSKTAVDETRVPHDALTPVDRLFADLTDRQLAALRLALDEGYFERPRRTSVAELAARTSVSRSTDEEHLRKARNKLLTNAGQFVRLVTATATADPLAVDPSRRPDQAAD
jgi:hypothetical protein